MTHTVIQILQHRCLARDIWNFTARDVDHRYFWQSATVSVQNRWKQTSPGSLSSPKQPEYGRHALDTINSPQGGQRYNLHFDAKNTQSAVQVFLFIYCYRVENWTETAHVIWCVLKSSKQRQSSEQKGGVLTPIPTGSSIYQKEKERDPIHEGAWYDHKFFITTSIYYPFVLSWCA